MQPGECVSLSGTSGAGKSLLLRAIADLDAHQGQIFLDEQECNTFTGSNWRCQVGLLPAESHWWRERAGDHFVRADAELLKRLNFSKDVLDWQITRLSSGERQRLALVRLLSQRPRVLLLDEPTASLDADNARCLEEVVAAYRSQHQAPVLWVSHDPFQAIRVASRGFSLVNGQLCAEAQIL